MTPSEFVLLANL